MSEIKVNSIKGVGASAAAITVNNTDGTCTANITNNLSNRNLIINGAMQVAQRGSAAVQINGYGSVDRFTFVNNSVTNNPTQAQVDVASSTTPYTLGFRKAVKFVNGSNTAGTDDILVFKQPMEAQNVASSGWNFKSSSSYITLSFWIKSSVAQNFYGYCRTQDGTAQIYPFETGSLTADTWTKITKTIPGNSNISIDSDTGEGFQVAVVPYLGTDRTDASVSLNAWAAYGSGTTRTPNTIPTWYTTNSATLEFTGVQLEVGSVATDFEHRSFGQELALCQRYYQRIDGSDVNTIYGVGNVDGGNQGQILVTLGTPLRAKASSMDTTGSSADYKFRVRTTQNCDAVPTLLNGGFTQQFLEWQANGHGFSDGQAALAMGGSSSSFLAFSAEL